MSSPLIPFASAHFCAFCRHWFDPCCISIHPMDPAGNVWKVQKENKNPCVLHHTPKSALQTCQDFTMKL